MSVGVAGAGGSTSMSGNAGAAGSGGSVAEPEPPCQQEPGSAASNDWTVTLGNPSVVPNIAGVPTYQWIPDGHFAVVQVGSGQWAAFWAEWENYRTLGSSPLLSDQKTLSPGGKINGGRGADGNSWDTNGLWIMSVFKQQDQKFIGFFHAEDQDQYDSGNGQMATRLWKSMAVSYSPDEGASWVKNQQILSTPKLAQSHGGHGDGSVVWDKCNARWVMFYQHSWLSAAMSEDPNGAPGTWKKLYNGAFTEPGLGGLDGPFDTSPQLAGPNPSVHWNTYLGQWIMVVPGWAPPSTYITSSRDLVHWTSPQVLMAAPAPDHELWYPTIVGSGGDTLAGEHATLYYADDIGGGGSRTFMSRTISFHRND